MPITPLPTPVPSRADTSNFAARGDAFLTALPTFAAEAEATRVEINANTAICQSAAQTVNVTAWVSGTTYAVGDCRFDTTDFLTYRRKTAGAGTTRPGLDGTNWQLLTGFGDATLGTAQTFTGTKTFSQPIVGSVTGSAADCSRRVTGAGLAAGGGALTADRTITVTAATQAQAEAGTDTATAMTPQRVEQHMLANALGWGQTWHNVLGGRAASTSYQNTTGRPIAVNVTGVEGTANNGRNFEVSSDNAVWVTAGRVGSNNNSLTGVSVVVPVQWYYRLNGSMASINSWVELR